MVKRIAQWSLLAVRRTVVAVIGGTILLLGLLMLVTPGPGMLVIPVGLGILGLEFAWARHWLKKAREMAQNGAGRFRNRGNSAPSSVRQDAGSVP